MHPLLPRAVLVLASLACLGLRPATAQLSAELTECLRSLSLKDLTKGAACLDQAVSSGPEALTAVAGQLQLTAVQPAMTVQLPPRRLKETATAPIEVGLVLTNSSDRPALVRPGAITATAVARFQSFGFTWDAGASSAAPLKPLPQRASSYSVVQPDDSHTIWIRLPLATEMIGRYSIELTLSYDGALTIPQLPDPGWVTTVLVDLEYLPSASATRKIRPVGNGTLRIDSSKVKQLHDANAPIEIEVEVVNPSSKTKIVLPDPVSFFGAPFWYVMLDTTSDEIVASGNLLPLEEMIAESSSTEMRVLRMAESATVPLAGRIDLDGLPHTSLTCVIGCTVAADHGEQGLWIGQAVAPDVRLEILR